MQELNIKSALKTREQTLQKNHQSLKALKPKAKKLPSVKALKLYIQQRLNDHSENNEQFYYKAAWRLSEAQVNNILERSQTAKSPIRYFLSAASSEMKNIS